MPSTPIATKQCDLSHIGTGVECGGVAVYEVWAHGKVRHVCEAGARRQWATGRQPCFQCHRPKWKCWDYLPIEVNA